MFVTEKFQQFHAELMRLQERLRGGDMFDADPAEPRTAAALSTSATWRRVISTLERHEAEAMRQGGALAVEQYKRAQYAMAALADEIFLNLDWPGREAWRQNLVEAKLFGTHRAGEEMFLRIDELLRDRDGAGGNAEIARVFISVLALGFQGKLRGRPDAEEEIETIRRRLYRFIYTHDPRVVRGREAVVPQTYVPTLNRPRVELPYLKPWLWAIAAITLLWLAGSHLIWSRAVSEISPLVDRILGTPTATSTQVAGARR